MRWGNDLLDLAERFRQAQDMGAAWDALKAGVGRFGGAHCGYMFSWTSGDGGGRFDEVLLHFDYPDSFSQRYEEAGHVDHDWSIIHCSRESEALYVSSDPAVRSRLTARQLEVEHDASEFGLRHYLTMPLRDDAQGWGGMAVDFHGLTEGEFEGAVSSSGEDIRRIGMLFHGTVRQQPGLGGLVELSAREREVLTWTADGRSSKVIAHRLNLSTRTVEHHIASAQKRLGAHNRTHAVAKALVLNLIQP